MRKIIILSVLFCALIVTAQAQTEKPKPILFFGGGMGLPMGPDLFKDFWKSGIGIGGGVGFEVNPNIELQAAIYYNNFPTDEDAFLDYIADMIGEDPTGLSLDGGSTRIIEAMANAKYKLGGSNSSSSVKPYVLGGAGFANLSFSDVTASYEGETETVTFESTTKLALNIGAGADFMVGPKIGIFVEGKYSMVFTEGDATNYVPIRAGMTFKLGSE
ncbi:MAG: outer membrane beta-barrel protein [candidate division Zixibacteria bacterium]|nr:outer membrane beta-barrel protein [candidate division Zixibacteria bacterium]